MPEAPIKVTVTDPESGEVLDERTLADDYLILCHGRSYLAREQHYPTTGTSVLTVKRVPPGAGDDAKEESDE